MPPQHVQRRILPGFAASRQLVEGALPLVGTDAKYVSYYLVDVECMVHGKDVGVLPV